MTTLPPPPKKKTCRTTHSTFLFQSMTFNTGWGVPPSTSMTAHKLVHTHTLVYTPSSSLLISLSLYLGLVLESFNTFARQRDSEAISEVRLPFSSLYSCIHLMYSLAQNLAFHPALVGQLGNCIQLAACGAKELLPMNPKLPADLFTACLTTPIKTALLWYSLQRVGKLSLISGVTPELIDQ